MFTILFLTLFGLALCALIGGVVVLAVDRAATYIEGWVDRRQPARR